MKRIVLIVFMLLILALSVVLSSFLTPKTAPSVPEESAPTEVFAVSAKELSEGFFRPVSSLEKGTAGSSLKEAIRAVDVLSFAVSSGMQRSDSSVLQQNLLSAWNMLNAEEQGRFRDNYPSLSALLDGCIADFSSYSGLFEDAGVLPGMEALLQNPDAPSAWKLLSEAWEAVS